jgi:MSHA pilin protein MshC
MKVRSTCGFSLVELVIVLALFAVVAVAVVSRIQRTEVDLVGETELIKAHLRFAQTRAMGSEAIWGVQCDTGSTYWLYRNGDPTDQIALPGEKPAGIDLAAKGFALEPFILSFDAWGTPHTDAAATDGQELQSSDTESTLTLSRGSATRTISITPNTGFIP